MSRSRSAYVVSMRSIFHFHLHFHYDCQMSYYFWMITWIKNMNNSQVAKVEPQGVAGHLLDFLPISA